MTAVVAERELYRSCEILFGLGLNLNRDFLEYLQPAGIKTAYRQRVRETHPDLAATRGEVTLRHNTALFIAVQEAYENLDSYLKARESGFRFSRRKSAINRKNGNRPAWEAADKPKKHPGNASWYASGKNSFSKRNGKTTATSKAGATATTASKIFKMENSSLYQGSLPARPLLFGHFLYFSGIINWRAIIQALVWQRTNRPKLGELGCNWGWLNKTDVHDILKERTLLQPFGESAVSMGLLTERQKEMLIFHQRRLQRRIGNYFVETAILSQEKLNQLIKECLSHNAQYSLFSQARYKFK